MEGTLDGPGLYGPNSISWRVNRESVLLLGGRRALLMQLAHPLVAQAVADHSRFAEDRVGRLLSTLRLSFAIVFGAPTEAQEAVDRINAVHDSVRGVLPEAAGRFAAGTEYRANDPDLLMWVHATLADTALGFYERFVGPLSDADRERFCRESHQETEMLGVPRGMLPADFSALQAYLERMIQDGSLAVTDTARALAAEILYLPIKWIPRRVFDPLNLITAGTLPPEIRRGFGLPWNPAYAAALAMATFALRRIVPVAPPPLRFVPQARAAERRMGHQDISS